MEQPSTEAPGDVPEEFYSANDLVGPTKPFRSKSALYANVAAGKFPRPIQITPGSSLFIKREVDAHVARAIAARDAEPVAARPVVDKLGRGKRQFGLRAMRP